MKLTTLGKVVWRRSPSGETLGLSFLTLRYLLCRASSSSLFVAYCSSFVEQVRDNYGDDQVYFLEVVAFVKNVPYPVMKFLCEECGFGSPFRARTFVTEVFWNRFFLNVDLFVKQEVYNLYRDLGGFPQLFELVNENFGRDPDEE